MTDNIPIPFDPQLELVEAYVAEVRALGTEPSREQWEAMWQKWVHADVNLEGLTLIGLKQGWIG